MDFHIIMFSDDACINQIATVRCDNTPKWTLKVYEGPNSQWYNINASVIVLQCLLQSHQPVQQLSGRLLWFSLITGLFFNCLSKDKAGCIRNASSSSDSKIPCSVVTDVSLLLLDQVDCNLLEHLITWLHQSKKILFWCSYHTKNWLLQFNLTQTDKRVQIDIWAWIGKSISICINSKP